MRIIFKKFVKEAKSQCRSESQRAGFSLVEVMIAMFILTFFTAALFKGLLYAKYTAEDNLYTSTALTVAVSLMEQMKGASINQISSPKEVSGKEIFTMIVEGGADRDLILGEPNKIEIPLVTDPSGVVSKTFDITINASIEEMDEIGYWLSIRYSYAHPRTGRIRTEVIHNARSTVRSL
jgi:prepilin-type N-terminal cleavage/methylation domain-containing protein